jgi:DNA polymerase III sliding clamp (beta) subunit (PCNA family)
MSKIFKSELKSALQAADTDKARYATDTVRIERENIVSTDCKALMVLTRISPDETKEGQDFEPIMIPYKDCKKILKACPGGKKECEILITKEADNYNTYKVECNGVTLSFKSKEGHFPPYTHVIPDEEPSFHVGLGVDLLEDLLAAARFYGVPTLRFDFTDSKNAVKMLGRGNEEDNSSNFMAILMPVNLAEGD